MPREVPIMDGSAAAFVERDRSSVGIRELSQPRKFIKVLKPIRVEDGDCWGELTPHSSFHLDVEIDFPTAADRPSALGAGDERRGVPQRDFAGPARSVSCATWRTCGRPAWRSAPRLTTRIALADDRIMNAEGLRYPQEFVRHKMLDAVGDLALAGAPMLGVLPLRSRRSPAERSRRCRPCLPTKMPGRWCVHPGCARSFRSRFPIGVGRCQLRRRSHLRRRAPVPGAPRPQAIMPRCSVHNLAPKSGQA